MNYITNLFHFNRKINRSEFWIGILLALPLQLVLLVGFPFLFYAFKTSNEILSVIASIISCIPIITLCVQRWRDVGVNPVVGVGFLLLVLLYKYDVLFFGMELLKLKIETPYTWTVWGLGICPFIFLLITGCVPTCRQKKIREKQENIRVPETNVPAILLAVASQDIMGVKEIIQQDPFSAVRAFDEHTGNTALHVAALNGYTNIISELLLAGADLHAENNEGKTPLMLATENGKLEAADLLKQAQSLLK